jgi:uncharacterized protein YkwD
MFLMLGLPALPLSAAAPTATDEILAMFQTRAKAGEPFDDLCEAAGDLPGPAQKQLVAEIEKIWPRLRDAYLAELAKGGAAPSAKTGGDRQEIARYRAEFMVVYRKDEASMKPLLKSTSMPAVEALRKLLVPDAEQLAAAGGSALGERRRMVQALARLRDGILKSTISTIPMDSATSLAAGEKAAAQALCGFKRDDLKILDQNRKIAEDNDIPEAEARGIEECNEWRMLVGLNALLIDPNLCEAARDHSKDMQELGFFAHESPVAGKKTPWDRAKRCGTTASGENIFMGSADPHGANRGWFYSPGHHKNMFNPSQRRIGLGCTGSHWTQMFGS